ncbi:NADH dehydrogenase subunit K [Haladaptatus litoreus]|uniref:NADH dehydrogenase subunit K n=1 Tax=Haladaptatus litoreus TaxID=553468 RepID=A0A1N6WTH3_9EURY|nr:NADH-quinone oxidoreductase subunit NuoK [Haladaptatus litoreus]SIQ93291.1 NADH dehydrogenase subunit K [Haladaptatus litoreus]
MAVAVEYYLLLSAAVFCTGLFGILTRRNALMFLISVELMLNAANINLVAFSHYHGNLTGQTFSLFTLALGAAEVAVGIGIILVLYRNFKDVDVTQATTMRW